MKDSQPAIIEMRVRSMEHAIVTALQDYEGKIQKEIRNGVSECVKKFDFKNEIKRVVEQEFNALFGYKFREMLSREIEKQYAPKLMDIVRSFSFDVDITKKPNPTPKQD